MSDYNNNSENTRFVELSEERFTSWADNGKACDGCMFAYGDTPMDDAPDKCSCEIYKYPKSKPDSVYLDGEECKYKRKRGEQHDKNHKK